MTITPYPKNAKKHPQSQIKALARAIEAFGFSPAIEVDKNGVIISGHGRFLASQELGWNEYKEASRSAKGVEVVPYIVLEDLSSTEIKQKRLADNKLAESDVDMLLAIEELREIELDGGDITLTGYDDTFMNKYTDSTSGIMVDKFGILPFSVLDARKGVWQDRKRQWLALGLKSDLGRDKDLLVGMKQLVDKQSSTYKTGVGITGTSVFDPVLSELSYKWFCPSKGKIVDPFCGGSVRGIVASKLGYEYSGTELRDEQVQANIEQGREILKEGDPVPNWITDDAMNIETHITPDQDMLFTCPPYYDLEVYSDDPRDISNSTYEAFLESYREIIKRSTSLLKDNRFAVVVVGEVRAKNGEYPNFVGDTIQAFKDAGLHYYNEVILVTIVATLAMRINKQFTTGRKIGKTHQNVLVFWKGDPKEVNKTVKDWEIGAWLPTEDETIEDIQ